MLLEFHFADCCFNNNVVSWVDPRGRPVMNLYWESWALVGEGRKKEEIKGWGTDSGARTQKPNCLHLQPGSPWITCSRIFFLRIWICNVVEWILQKPCIQAKEEKINIACLSYSGTLFFPSVSLHSHSHQKCSPDLGACRKGHQMQELCSMRLSI